MNVLKLTGKHAKHAQTWIRYRDQKVAQKALLEKVTAEIVEEQAPQQAGVVEHVIFLKEFVQQKTEEAKQLALVCNGLQQVAI